MSLKDFEVFCFILLILSQFHLSAMKHVQIIIISVSEIFLPHSHLIVITSIWSDIHCNYRGPFSLNRQVQHCFTGITIICPQSRNFRHTCTSFAWPPNYPSPLVNGQLDCWFQTLASCCVWFPRPGESVLLNSWGTD